MANHYHTGYPCTICGWPLKQEKDKIREWLKIELPGNSETVEFSKTRLIEIIEKYNMSQTEFKLNDFVNGLLCRRDIKIEGVPDSNKIANAINKYLKKL